VSLHTTLYDLAGRWVGSDLTGAVDGAVGDDGLVVDTLDWRWSFVREDDFFDGRHAVDCLMEASTLSGP